MDASLRHSPEPARGTYSPIVRAPVLLTRARLDGFMLGTALGDALGLPVETLDAGQIAGTHGVLARFIDASGNKFFKGQEVPVGSWSDDAQLTAALFHAFADAGGYDLKAIGDRHVEAYRESSLGWGGSTVAGVKALIAGLPPEDPRFVEGLRGGTGNGIPMKIGAVAAYLAITGGSEADLVKMVTGVASLSHRTSISVSAGLAHAAALLYCMASDASTFSTERFAEVVTAASRLGREIYPQGAGADDITERFARVADFRGAPAADIIAAFGGGGCYVYDSLPFSYAFFLRNPLRFDAVVDVVNAGGDTDSNGAFVAGLQGALLGRSFLPPELVAGIHAKEKLVEACDRFAAEFAIR